MKPDQHHVRSVGDTDREEVAATIRKAIRELQALEATLPPVLIDGLARQRGTAHNYIENVALRVAETCLDCTLWVSLTAASLGNSDFDVKGCREAMMDALTDELADARAWADEREEEAA